MPLRDHFRPPLDEFTSWEGFHGQWPANIVRSLDSNLPAQFVAEPRVHVGAQIEVDIATFDSEPDELLCAPNLEENDSEATAWAPAQPTLAVKTDEPDHSEYEVRIYDLKRGRRLVAAIEIVSPSNKDRMVHRQRFVSKCARLLERQVSVTMIDLVTSRESNLYQDLLDLIGQTARGADNDPSSIFAVSCRWLPVDSGRLLEAWHHPLQIGAPLPILPIWLTRRLCVPLDLEETYEQTCRDLRYPGSSHSKPSGQS